MWCDGGNCSKLRLTSETRATGTENTAFIWWSRPGWLENGGGNGPGTAFKQVFHSSTGSSRLIVIFARQVLWAADETSRKRDQGVQEGYQAAAALRVSGTRCPRRPPPRPPSNFPPDENFGHGEDRIFSSYLFGLSALHSHRRDRRAKGDIRRPGSPGQSASAREKRKLFKRPRPRTHKNLKRRLRHWKEGVPKVAARADALGGGQNINGWRDWLGVW